MGPIDGDLKIVHFHDGVIYYNYQNPSVFCFPMLIRAIVIQVPLVLQNNDLKKTKSILEVVIKQIRINE